MPRNNPFKGSIYKLLSGSEHEAVRWSYSKNEAYPTGCSV